MGTLCLLNKVTACQLCCLGGKFPTTVAKNTKERLGAQLLVFVLPLVLHGLLIFNSRDNSMNNGRLALGFREHQRAIISACILIILILNSSSSEA
ncbi:hypothetical protein B0H16DRAFT_376112 [Mycena metata]|uniref:Uncharacterized protein n=1 Tax=Mycena metata TaxID=1033252 RepID=A0AAD7HJ99_9AGAR|nr:hypothetical protein B0H16DRAFT_376112 [Mycena metata]